MMAEKGKRAVVGILAHVDAGKTTLAEGILYLSGRLRKPGRVDHKDAFLDTYELEKARGITIFSKQALVTLGDWEVTLLDTPGHADFSAEMERTLQVLDMAVLLVSAADGVQGHVETLWRLLSRYRVPVFLFVNKMDQEGTDREALLKEIQERLDEKCVDFCLDTEKEGKERTEKGERANTREAWLDNVAMCSEELMEEYLETGGVSEEGIRRAVAEREIFPCFFGSALKLTGVGEFLEGLGRYLSVKGRKESFGARVFKISRDRQGNRLTHMKITGGSLKVKTLIGKEKVDQIRIYDGLSYKPVQEALEGSVCAVTGLSDTHSGQGFGLETEGEIPLLEPVLTYRVKYPEDRDAAVVLGKLKQLEEEIPELHIVWKEGLGEIHAQVMGEVQIEILKSLVEERFGFPVWFDEGSILYKETIAAPVEGIGHFEPLRHYAEVHLLMEPLEPGSGLQFASDCSEDMLDRNWQNQILSCLEDRRHAGVLTGSEITDMKITLVAGRAHVKHTEGGDFRQAACRAVRQGLRKAENILLEPVYEFSLELPSEMSGRAMADIRKMQGSFAPLKINGETALLKGKAPAVNIRNYPSEVVSYTKGRGRLTCALSGYEPCHNAREVVERTGYDPDADMENPSGSVFCAHGAGFVVPWDQVDQFAHVKSEVDLEAIGASAFRYGDLKGQEPTGGAGAGESVPGRKDRGEKGLRESRANGGNAAGGSRTDEEELEEIFTRTYGPIKRQRNPFSRGRGQEMPENGDRGEREKGAEDTGTAGKDGEYLLVDGYNIIFAWEDLRNLSRVSIDGARNRLMDILCNYQGFRKNTVILVFDAYKVKGNPGSVEKYHNIYVIYTKEAETADQYIEKTVHRIGKKYQVTVATSDALEQMIIWGDGAVRMSAAGLREEIQNVSAGIRESSERLLPGGKHYPFRNIAEEWNPGKGDA